MNDFMEGAVSLAKEAFGGKRGGQVIEVAASREQAKPVRIEAGKEYVLGRMPGGKGAGETIASLEKFDSEHGRQRLWLKGEGIAAVSRNALEISLRQNGLLGIVDHGRHEAIYYHGTKDQRQSVYHAFADQSTTSTFGIYKDKPVGGSAMVLDPDNLRILLPVAESEAEGTMISVDGVGTGMVEFKAYRVPANEYGHAYDKATAGRKRK